MKHYEQPELKVIVLCAADVIKTSYDNDPFNDKSWGENA